MQYTLVGSHISQGSLDSVQRIAIPEGATGILVQARTQDVSIKLGEQNDPSASEGFVIVADQPPQYIALASGNGAIHAIEVAASATLEVQGVKLKDVRF
jgi:hypothetical protein